MFIHTTKHLMNRFKSTGIIKTSAQDSLYKLWVEVDVDLVKYYFSLLPKYYNANRQRYAPHISVIRENKFVDFSRFNNLEIEFEYDPFLYIEEIYVWINVYSDFLGSLRELVGLPKSDWYTKPPDGNDGFHITIGNFKHLVRK